MLLVSAILENAADVAPDAIAATLDDDVLTFAEIDTAGEPHRATRCSTQGVGRGDRVLWWGDTDPRRGPRVRGAGQARRGVRAAQRPGVARRSHAGGRATPGPGCCSPAPRTRRSAPELRTRARRSVRYATSPACGRCRRRRPTSTLDERDPHVIFFTSGSTGRPKGVVLSHRSRTGCARSWARPPRPAAAGTVCMFPLFHMAGLDDRARHVAGAAAGALRRACPTRRRCSRPTERHRAARLYCIPAVWGRILEHGVGRYDLSTLVEADTGTSATPPELLAAIKDALPHTVTRVFYGSTEAGPTLSLPDADLARKPGSVGVAQPGVEVRLDERGEVCARSPFLMDGYFDDPDATNEALVDGWYHTGDLGVLDDDGYVSIVGRARDVIRTGGETVAPPEVEAVLGTHPDVIEVAVVGVPDVEWGEVVTAVVIVATRRRRAHGRGRSAPSATDRLAGVQTAPAGRDRSTRSPHRRHRPDPTPPDRRAAPAGNSPEPASLWHGPRATQARWSGSRSNVRARRGGCSRGRQGPCAAARSQRLHVSSMRSLRPPGSS